MYLAGGTKGKKWSIHSSRSSETVLVKLFISHKGWQQLGSEVVPKDYWHLALLQVTALRWRMRVTIILEL